MIIGRIKSIVAYFNLFQVKNRLHEELKCLKLKYKENDSLIVDAQIKTD